MDAATPGAGEGATAGDRDLLAHALDPADDAQGWVNRALSPEELWLFVDRLAARIASFPPHAVAAAKASVLRAEHGVYDHLLAEAAALGDLLGEPSTRRAMQRFLELGGRTPEGERRLGELAGEIG